MKKAPEITFGILTFIILLTACQKEHTMDLSEYTLTFEDDFSADTLDSTKWLPYYLPHWTSANRSRADYFIEDGTLTLRVTDELPAWSPDLNGSLSVSNLQTGHYSGPVGSSIGQHRYHPDCIVQSDHQNVQLFTPQFGYFEIRAKAILTKYDVAAFWMIGYEDQPHKAGEICIMEVKGHEIGENQIINGSGIHPFGDSSLVDEFYFDSMPIDISEYHVFGAEWTDDQVYFYLDGELYRTIDQSPQYPMQFMVDIFRVPPDENRPSLPPGMMMVDYIRGYERRP